jgi:caffeoyl-CoA O-methyltransferase
VADAPKSFFVPPEIHDYMLRHGTAPDAVQSSLIEETRKLGGISMMQIAPEQGALMTLLARAIGARRAVEVGTFTGYSALCIARGLGEGGKLLCCDVSEEWTSIGRRHWEKAGVAERIELRIGPAADTLRSLPEEEVFDLGFIDADKEGYATYYEEILRRMRPNGLLLVDNVLWFGNVARAEAQDPSTIAIRAFNGLVANDERVDCVMLAVSDGLTILRKR